ncbi:MAG: hypothetical protein M9962_05270 [Oligoflexia bacterium]|nr:hypothetical protein [Oligoflexia bacterium]
MKAILTALVLTFGLQTHAKASVCIEKILKFNQWEQASQSQVECLLNDENFLHATKELCNKKRSAPSEMFKKYLAAEAKYNEIMAKLREVPVGSPKMNALAYELRQAETDWIIFGYKNEVQYIQWTYLRDAEANCIRQ